MWRPIAAVLTALSMTLPARATVADYDVRYTKTPTGYLVVLHQGDDVIASLERLAAREDPECQHQRHRLHARHNLRFL